MAGSPPGVEAPRGRLKFSMKPNHRSGVLVGQAASGPGMKFPMRPLLRRSQSRLRTEATDRGGERLARALATSRLRFAALDNAGAHDAHGAKQGALWAACLVERPDIMSDIAAFIQDARLRVTDSPRAKARSDDA